MKDVTKKDKNKVSLQQKLSKLFLKNLSRVLDNTYTFKKLSIEEWFKNSLVNIFLFVRNHRSR